MLENPQPSFDSFLTDAMNDETKNGVSFRKSKVEPSAQSPRPGAKGGSGWGDFDSIVDEAERYFIDEDDANRFFSVFKWSPTSSTSVAECHSPIAKNAEKVRLTPVKKSGNDEIFYKERIRARSFDLDLPFDSTPLSPTSSLRRKARHNRSKGADLPVNQEVDKPVVVRGRSQSSSDATVPDKFVPLEGHRSHSRNKDRSSHRRRHRSTSRGDHSSDEKDLAATSASPTTTRERRRRHRRERSVDSVDGKDLDSATPSTSLSRSPHRNTHSRHNRHHRTSTREKEEEELIKLSSAIMLGEAPPDSLAVITAERQRKLLEKASKRSHRRNQSSSPVPGGEHN